MIYILEAFVEDYLHVLANVNIIKIFKNIHPEQPIFFSSPKKHNDNVRKYFTHAPSNIRFDPFENLTVDTGNIFKRTWLILSRFFRDIRVLLTTFRRAKANDIIVITHIYFTSLVLIKIIKKFYPRKATYLVIHGDVEYVFYPKGMQQTLVGFFHKLMFKFSCKNFHYIFLTPISKQILVSAKLIKENEGFAIELPTFATEDLVQIQNTRSQSEIIKIGHIGSAGTRKNVHYMFKVAQELEHLIKNGLIQLINVGVLEGTIKPFLSPLVIDYVDGKINKPLSREQYDVQISRLDYAVFFYGQTDFILRSSAAFFDAIFFEKPMIVLKNPFFIEVFDRAGAIGYICEDLDDMVSLITDLIKSKANHESRYLTFVENIRKYKSSLRIENISDKLGRDFKQQINSN